jgi:lauroyl/myristoyl acyltransferase
MSLRHRLFLRLVTALAKRAVGNPYRVYRFAERLGDLFRMTGFGRLPPGRLRQVFPDLPAETALAMERESTRLLMRHEVAQKMITRTGVDTLRSNVDSLSSQLSALRGPLIVGAFHVGAFGTIGAALARFPGQVLVLRRRANADRVTPPNITNALTEGSEEQRARVFHDAVGVLRGKGFVCVLLDPIADTARIEVPFERGTLSLARGPFALARMAQCPILPLMARWNGFHVEFELGDLIPPSDDEASSARIAAIYLESYLRRHPREISPRILELARP